MARRRRRFFRDFFWRFFTCFHGNSAYLRPCYHALRQPVGAADRAMLHNLTLYFHVSGFPFRSDGTDGNTPPSSPAGNHFGEGGLWRLGR